MSSEKKYMLTDEFKYVDNVKVFRIQALQSFGNITAGELGGFVQSEENLSQNGKCWIYDEACAMHKSIVADDATLKDNATISGAAVVQGKAEISWHAKLTEYAIVSDCARVSGYSIVSGKGQVCGHSFLGGHSGVFDNAKVKDRAAVEDSILCDNAFVGDCASAKGVKMFDDSSIHGYVDVTNYKTPAGVTMSGNSYIEGRGRGSVTGEVMMGDNAAIVCQKNEISQNMTLGANALIKSDDDYMSLSSLWSGSHAFRCSDGVVRMTGDCTIMRYIGIEPGCYSEIGTLREHMHKSALGQMLENDCLSAINTMANHFGENEQEISDDFVKAIESISSNDKEMEC